MTKKGGEAVIPGVGALGTRHEDNYGVGCKHYIHMREALLHAISTLLGREYNDEIGRAWAKTFDMLSEAMQKHERGNPEAVAFARLFHRRTDTVAPQQQQQGSSADSYFDGGSGKDQLNSFLNNQSGVSPGTASTQRPYPLTPALSRQARLGELASSPVAAVVRPSPLPIRIRLRMRTLQAASLPGPTC